MRRLIGRLGSVPFVTLAGIVAAVVLFIPATAVAQATFHAVGDLPGGSFSSQIRDATKSNGTIYAVGAGNGQTPGCPNPCGVNDTAILWKWDGVSATITALPNLVVNTGATTPVIASAITPDGAYIASRGRSNAFNGQRQAVRVTTALVPFPSANLNLSSLFSPALAPSTFANGISADGSVLYGQSQALGQAVRFDAAGSSSMLIPLLPGALQSGSAAKGVSADGSVMVGSSGPFGSGSRAFRYVHGSGVTEIPKLAGGTWNASLSVSSNGNIVLVAGDSPTYPNGEFYLYDASTGATTSLGSPNSPWTPANIAGMTADGSVIAAGFGGPSRGFAYFHNSRGWFHLASALGANGIDLKAQGWTEFGVLGISADGTLVFGQGIHNEQVEGWVAEFPAGYLAAFDAPAVPVANTSIVGAWHVNDVESGSPAIVVFMADGTYYIIQPTVQASEINAAPGFERGVYYWNATTGALRFATLNDTNGDAGASDNNGSLNGTLFVSGDTFTLSGGGPIVGTRIVAPAGTPLKDTLVGGWVIGNPAVADSSLVAVFDADGTYYLAQDGPVEGGARDGIEKGTYSWDGSTKILTPTSIAVDTNGDWGLSNPFGASTIQPFIDGLRAQAGDASGLMTAYRIIDPTSVIPVITSPLSAAGTFSTPFSYSVTATNGAYQFAATGLPAGLAIDGATGLISGTPTVDGTFSVNLSASNSLRTGTATLRLTVSKLATWTGFYQPVSSNPGDVNVIKGGSTVPLKFDVSVNGVQKTDTAGLSFSVVAVSCSGGGSETPVPADSTGGTSLRYGGPFIQNWSSPTAVGCYIARMSVTGASASISAFFRVK